MAYRLREVPLAIDGVEPRGSMLDGWGFWSGGIPISYDKPTSNPPRVQVFVGTKGHLVLARRERPPGHPVHPEFTARPLPGHFVAADNGEAAKILGLPEVMIPVLYAKYDADTIVPRDLTWDRP